MPMFAIFIYGTERMDSVGGDSPGGFLFGYVENDDPVIAERCLVQIYNEPYEFDDDEVEEDPNYWEWYDNLLYAQMYLGTPRKISSGDYCFFKLEPLADVHPNIAYSLKKLSRQSKIKTASGQPPTATETELPLVPDGVPSKESASNREFREWRAALVSHPASSTGENLRYHFPRDYFGGEKEGQRDSSESAQSSDNKSEDDEIPF